MFFSWELVSYRWFLGELPGDLKADNADKIYYHIKSQMEDEKYDENYVMKAIDSLLQKPCNSAEQFFSIPFLHTVHIDMLVKLCLHTLMGPGRSPKFLYSPRIPLLLFLWQ